jgi:MFS family permease
MKVTFQRINHRVQHMSWQQTFAALHYYNYRLWFIGQLVSLIGTWMQTTAQAYLVFELTKSPAYLGYVGFAAGLPVWLFTLYGGVVADRVSRRTLMVITQSAMMILAFILAWLVFAETVQPWQIILLAFLLGIANAFDAPTRQAFVVELVDRQDLTNAIALNSIMFNAAVVVGPAVAGLTYAAFGPAWCFTINGLSFIAVIVALLLMRIQPMPRREGRTSTVTELKEGLRYVASNSKVRMLIGSQAVISLFGIGFMTLFPAWAVTVLGGNVTTNGLMLSARGLGAVAAGLMIAALGRYRSKGKLWTLGSFLMPVMMLVFSLVRWIPLSLAVLVILGWSFMVLVNTSNALVQTNISDNLRGRVMSLFTLAFFGFMPIGSLLAGSMANLVSEPVTVAFSALVLLAFAVFIWFRLPALRKLE